MLYLLIAHGAGAAGGLLGKKLRVPAGAMIGAVLAVVLLNNLSGQSMHYPPQWRTAVQILSGSIIGCRFTRKDLREMKTMVLPALILVVMLFGFNLLFAFFISYVSPLGMMTALFASAPGGVTDLALIAADFGADTEIVTLLQLVRFVFVILLFPPLMKKLFLGKPQYRVAPSAKATPHTPIEEDAAAKIPRLGATLALAAALGLLFKWFNIPAGPVIGGIVAAIVLNLAAKGAYIPGWLKTAVQIFAGCYIGGQVTQNVVLALRGLVLPMLLVMVEVLVMAFATAAVLRLVYKTSWATSLFSSTPGGIAEMGVIAEEMGLDTPKIVLMHTCRVIAVICMMPILMRLFSA